ncbi:hypothetical protein A6U87_17625 [Rhizobium sp. AC44/96]|uniref:hypothetical protein n=1 Tax=Rhizobium sp. AC44/96 TaxID=1841654 RepID=UPI00080FF289|nr:hypothetical protein [Rhizobium sp. AC44/96]OCJ03754.1 hypothetical protein A6U87_17625 [Rhizobium sp. AC44/96]
MKVLYCHKVRNPRSTECIASVDFELNEHVRIYGLRLMKKSDGRHFIFAPQAAGSRRVATFSEALSARLTELAVEAFKAAA